MRIDTEALAIETWARVRRAHGTDISVDKIIKEIEATIKEVVRLQNDNLVHIVSEKSEKQVAEIIEELYST